MRYISYAQGFWIFFFFGLAVFSDVMGDLYHLTKAGE